MKEWHGGKHVFKIIIKKVLATIVKILLSSLCVFTVAVCCLLLNLGLNQWKNYTCWKEEVGDFIKISRLNKRKQKHFSYKQLLQLNFTCFKFKFVGTGQLYGVPFSYQARPWEKTTPARLGNENLTHKLGQKNAWRLKT